ncbi:NUMOD4 domain-containing protein [Flavobacterium sp.]|uniref:NUMOD4 domain-containing protein n=1 Tax=Flavobacterium sp. TaxID=239 RepID=UPI003752B158
MKKLPKLRVFPNEDFREIVMHDSLKLKYAISNKGRLISYSTSMLYGRIVKGTLQDGYRIIRFAIKDDGVKKYRHLFFYNIVAEYFLPKTSEDQTFVLHLDYVRDNDDVRNLRLATREEMLNHSKKSPKVIEAQKKFVEGRFGADGASKLTSTKVMHIKKLLANPNRTTRKKIIAKQFGVTTMQIRRIETGENWSQVEI